MEHELLWMLLKKLNNRDLEIVKMRFGLMGNSEKTQKEVADIMGISQSYISRIEKGVINPSVATFYRIMNALGMRIEIVRPIA